MKSAIRYGLSFGVVSGVITTLGLMTGLIAGTHARSVVIGGVLMIAIADALSDSLGIHISNEVNHTSHKDAWTSTISAFTAKFVFALSFLIPLLLFDLKTAGIVALVWGAVIISVSSFFIARDGNNEIVPWKATVEHLALAAVVVLFTHFLGVFVSGIF